MNIKGKINVVVRVKQTKDGKNFNTYVGSLARKNKDGTYSYADYDVRFVGLTEVELADLKAGIRYQLDVEDGFISHREWSDKDKFVHKQIELCISKYKVLKSQAIKKQPVPTTEKKAE